MKASRTVQAQARLVVGSLFQLTACWLRFMLIAVSKQSSSAFNSEDLAKGEKWKKEPAGKGLFAGIHPGALLRITY